MKKYRVQTDKECSPELQTLELAERTYEKWKDYYMADGVIAEESFVEIVESTDDFDAYKVIKKVIAVVDDERTELGTPREEGIDWDYWADWREVEPAVLEEEEA